MGKQWKQWQTLFFFGSKITADGDYSHDFKKCLLLERKAMTILNGILKSRNITLPTNVHYSQSYGFSSSHVWIRELDHKESWVPKNWCFWIMVFKETLEGPLDCKEIQLVHHKGNQSWIFIGRTDAEAEAPILGHLMGRNYSLEETLMLGKIEGRRRRGRRQMRWLHGNADSMDMNLSKF